MITIFAYDLITERRTVHIHLRKPIDCKDEKELKEKKLKFATENKTEITNILLKFIEK